MNPRDFRNRLRQGHPLLGTLVTLRAPEVAELLACAGYEWLFLDGEHGPLESADILAILQAVGERSTCLVRVPALAETPVKKALDAGAGGIIFPQINTPEAAAQAVAWCRYPPLGQRGMGLGRAHRFGFGAAEYTALANETVSVVIQAEHREAVEQIDALAQVSGVDAILVGPNDLAASFGKPGQLDDPEVVGAIERVAEVCQRHGMPLGIFGRDPAAVAPWQQKGFRLIVCGVDVLLLGGAASKQLSALRDVF